MRGFLILIIPVIITVLAIIGEVKCIIKAVKCDWEPSYKAEIIYTASSLCGVGAIVGWINIEDVKKKGANEGGHLSEY